VDLPRVFVARVRRLQELTCEGCGEPLPQRWRRMRSTTWRCSPRFQPAMSSPWPALGQTQRIQLKMNRFHLQ
jgi:hypothetical protein